MTRRPPLHLLVLAALGGLPACQAPVPPAEIAADTLMSYVDAQLAFGPRFPGSPGHLRMKVWLDSMLRQRAEQVESDDWVHTTAGGDTLQLRNILARFRPDLPARVLYLTHWDTRPRADSPASPDSLGSVLGANDGASGVAILLGVADALRARPPAIGVDLLFVDGEDFGSFQDSTATLLGSRRYAAGLARNQRPRFAVVWDMLGDRDLRLQQEGYSLLAAPDLVARIWRLGGRLGYGPHLDAAPGRAIIDDHLPLQAVGVKTVNLIDLAYGPDNSWHHSTADTRDKVAPASLALSAHIATALLRSERP